MPKEPMKISDLIQELEKIKAEHGDLPVKIHTLSHSWEPEISIKSSNTKYVLLNS
jgi:hypothetical protein